MHRMRHLLAPTGLALLGLALTAPAASAGLINTTYTPTFPDIHATYDKGLDYTYDPSSQTGLLQLRNTTLAVFTSANDHLDINSDSSGDQYQFLSVKVDQNGNVVSDSNNTFEVFGKITTADGQSFDGLLLKGTPTSLGSKYYGDQDAKFDASLNITGGALAPYFGANAYLRVYPEGPDSFNGSFTTDFHADKATSDTYSTAEHLPIPAPEPATLLILVIGGGLIYRHRHRLTR